MRTDRLTFALELEPLPTGWRTPPEQRLRALLKAALRGYGLRCTAVKVVPPPEPEPGFAALKRAL
jgi:hypothetical protein